MKTYVVHRPDADSVMVPADIAAVDEQGSLVLLSSTATEQVATAVFAAGHWTHATLLPAGGAE